MGWVWVQQSHLTHKHLQEVYRWDECEYSNHTSHTNIYRRCTDGMSVSTGITPHTEPSTGGVQMGWVWVQESYLTQNHLQEVYRWDECEYRNHTSHRTIYRECTDGMSVSTGIIPHTEPSTGGVQMGWVWVQESHLTQNQLQEVYRWDECEYRNHTSHRINYRRCTDRMSVSTGITPHTEPTTGGVQIGWVWVQESHHTQNQLQEVYR